MPFHLSLLTAYGRRPVRVPLCAHSSLWDYFKKRYAAFSCDHFGKACVNLLFGCSNSAVWNWSSRLSNRSSPNADPMCSPFHFVPSLPLLLWVMHSRSIRARVGVRGQTGHSLVTKFNFSTVWKLSPPSWLL